MCSECNSRSQEANTMLQPKCLLLQSKSNKMECGQYIINEFPKMFSSLLNSLSFYKATFSVICTFIEKSDIYSCWCKMWQFTEPVESQILYLLKKERDLKLNKVQRAQTQLQQIIQNYKDKKSCQTILKIVETLSKSKQKLAFGALIIFGYMKIYPYKRISENKDKNSYQRVNIQYLLFPGGHPPKY